MRSSSDARLADVLLRSVGNLLREGNTLEIIDLTTGCPLLVLPSESQNLADGNVYAMSGES